MRSEVSDQFLVTFDTHGNVFGDTAMASGRAIIKGECKGREIGGEFKYTSTYAKQHRKEWAIKFWRASCWV